MRHFQWNWLACAVVVAALTNVAVAQQDTPQPKDDAAVATPDPTEIRANIHRTMAELIEAQGADSPNNDEIARLTKELQTLRAQLQPAAPAGFGRGPGQGMGRGQGRGRGQGMGAGQGAGRGQGWGRGPGWGCCQAATPGGGRGAGGGRGRGMGPGAGQGLGQGKSPGFVDQNGDGVCDRYAIPQADPKN